jgi:hypothetical protein
VSTMNGFRHGCKGHGNGVPPGWWQGHRGRRPPLSLNPREGTAKRRMKTETMGEVTLPPHSLLPKDLSSLGDISWQAGISISVGQPKRS